MVLSELMPPPAGGVSDAGGFEEAASSFLAPQPSTANAMVSARSATIAKAVSLLMEYMFTSSQSAAPELHSVTVHISIVGPNIQKHRSGAVSWPARSGPMALKQDATKRRSGRPMHTPDISALEDAVAPDACQIRPCSN